MMRTRTRVSTLRPTLVSVLCLCFSAGFISSCSRSGSELPSDTFAFGLGSDPETFDPGVMSGSVEGRVAYQIYEGLVSPGPGDDDLRPGVAERWEVSPDGSEYRFYLREDARWSNGDPVVAEDFREAWLRQLRGDIASDYIAFVRYLDEATRYEHVRRNWPSVIFDVAQPVLEARVGVSAPDDHTLIVRLEQPTPYFLDILSFYTMMPVHRPSIALHGQEAAFYADRAEHNLVTNGPYQIDEYRRRNVIRMVPNEHYWARDELAIEHLDFFVIEDNTARVTAYLDGRVDWINDPPNDQLRILRANPGFQSAFQLGVYYYRFNITHPALDDVRVRRALAMALNREELCRCTLDDLYTPAYSFVPPMPGYEPRELLAHDPAGARDLLAEAGYPGGEGFPELVILYNTSENHRVIAQAVQDMWRVELGIEVTLLNQEWKVYLETMEELDYMVARAGWIGDYVDPDTFLTLWRSGDPNNNTGFANTEYDALMAAQLIETDPDARRRLLEQAEELLLTELPVMPIYHYSQFHLVRPSVEGWEMNIRDVHLARWISKREGEGE